MKDREKHVRAGKAREQEGCFKQENNVRKEAKEGTKVGLNRRWNNGSIRNGRFGERDLRDRNWNDLEGSTESKKNLP